MEEVCVYVCMFPSCMGLFVIHAGTYVFVLGPAAPALPGEFIRNADS